MTRERALELVKMARSCGIVMYHHTDAQVADAILAAVAEEREACAKIADVEEETWSEDGSANHIACAIRERGIPLKGGA